MFGRFAPGCLFLQDLKSLFQVFMRRVLDHTEILLMTS
jgi:hypothetical protein